jgi:DNA invertase Pin-like site-specific DNA recombinase
MGKIGYISVLQGQNPSAQVKALKTVGVQDEDMYIDYIPLRGSNRLRRPQLMICLSVVIKPSDTLYVWRLDGLARSSQELLSLLDMIVKHKVNFHSINDDINLNTTMNICDALRFLVDFESRIMKERVNIGLFDARQRGIFGGRRKKLSPEQEKRLVRLYKADSPTKALMAEFEISRNSLYEYLHKNGVALRSKK